MNHEEKILRELTKAERSRKRKNVWYRLVSALACLTVFVTTYALILPALTLDVDEYAVCGKPDHTHTDSCYGTKLVLDCPLGAEPDASGSEGDPYQIAPDAGHVHTDACWKEVPDYENLICGLEEHKHDMNCFTSDPEDEYALCPVKYEHKHTDDCYGTEGVLLCGYQEHTHTDACYFLKDRTIESRPASDGAVAVISGMMPIHAKAEIEAVTLSQAELEAIFGAKRAATMTSFVAYDIRIMVNGAEWQPNDTVTVAVKQPDIQAEAGEGLAVAHVDGDTAEVSQLDIKVDAEGDVSFDTDGFSLYIFYTFTVDFHYGDVVFSMEGYDAITLSDLFRELEIPLDAAGAVKVTFSDERLLGVFRMKDDWLLTSLEPFSTDETLTVYFEDGTVFELYVTDKQGEDGGLGGSGTPAPEASTPPTKIEDGGTAFTGISGSATEGAVIRGWASDPDTSHLEDPAKLNEALNYTNGHLVSGRNMDDGKVLTDKSVVYKNDGYNAFSYNDNEFSVTLSALAQEYYLVSQYSLRAPLDVILVIDASGSMSINHIDADDKTSDYRIEAAVSSANATIAKIMADNPNNRVGVVVFSGISQTILPLDKYTANASGKYLTLEKAAFWSNKNPYQVIQVADGVKNSKGDSDLQISPPENNIDTPQGCGTNMQIGVARAEYEFEQAVKNGGNIYTETITKADGTSETFQFYRQPVYLLLSDGEPTYATPDYNNALHSQNYVGNGNYDEITGETTRDSKKVYCYPVGYYSILTNQYCKEQTTAKYYTNQSGVLAESEAIFCTIGIGIPDSDDKKDYASYMKAVLDPTDANLNAISTSNTRSKLKRLLKNTETAKTILVGNDKSYIKTIQGTSGTKFDIGIIRNPYSDYLYADKSYADDYTTVELQQVFDDILKTVLKVKDYGFLLNDNSSIAFTDTIGAGMEVINDSTGTAPDMILRYNGVNYPLKAGTPKDGKVPYLLTGAAEIVTIHHGSTEYKVNLKDIEVWVEETSGGQTVHFEIPSLAVPAYSPAFTETYEWYYQTMPARLIYKVGLTSEAKNEIANLTETREYWTNDGASVTFEPRDDNPYYFRITKEKLTAAQKEAKHQPTEKVFSTANDLGNVNGNARVKTGSITTGSENGNAWDYAMTNGVVTNVLGNNGKLTFAPNAMKIDVEKVWDPGSAPTDATVTVYLYKNEGSGWTAATDGTGKSSVTLSSGNSWKASFTGLAKLAGGQYAVSEAPMSGYTTTYRGSGDLTSSFGENLTGVNKVGFRVTADGSKSVIITNTAGSALPSTGGSGEKPFVLAGLGLIGLGALGAAFLLRRKRKREN